MNNKSHGIIDILFSTIKCSKENLNTLKLTTQSINESIEWMSKNSKLLGVRKGKECTCFWIDKKVTNIKVSDKATVTYRVDTVDFQIKTNFDLHTVQSLNIFTVFESMSYLVVSDLAAMFALMREGHSMSKYLKCNLKIAEWKKDKNKVGLDLNWDMVLIFVGKHSNKISVKEVSLLNIPIHCYICPLLHLLLGIVNNILAKGIIPFALRLDRCTDHEFEVCAMLDEIESGERTCGEKKLKGELKKLIKKELIWMSEQIPPSMMSLPSWGFSLSSTMVGH